MFPVSCARVSTHSRKKCVHSCKMSEQTKTKRQRTKILKNCSSCVFQCVAQQQNHELSIGVIYSCAHLFILIQVFILVRTVHTINFCLSYFAQHQKHAHRDFEKLERPLVVSVVTDKLSHWRSTVANATSKKGGKNECLFMVCCTLV